MSCKPRLDGKVAVVTGAGRGIGRAVAQAFAAEGARVVVNFRENAGAAAEVVNGIMSSGAHAIAFQADVSKRTDIRRLFDMTLREFGRIDVLVNNAGINRRGMFEETTESEWDDILAVNLKGPFLCCQEVFPCMKSQGGGRIINMSSVASQYHGPKTVHYAVSKAGLNCLTKVVARYGAEHGILVNAVAPGIILTDQTADELASEAGQRIVNLTLLKRPGALCDVAATCILLASDEQNYITGQVISVSGGAYLG